MKPAMLRVSASLMLGFLLTACASNSWLDAGKQQLQAGNADAALIYLEQAAREHPDDREARTLYLRQRETVINQNLAEADAARSSGNLEQAERSYRLVLKVDSRNLRATDGLAQLTATRRHSAALQEVEAFLAQGNLRGAEARLRLILTEVPRNEQARATLKRVQEKLASTERAAQALKSPFAQPVTLEFRDAPLRSVFEALAQTSGINFVLDKDIKADARVTVFMRQTALDEVIRLILVTNQLERKILNDNSILIYPNVPAKIKDYQELEARSFFLANADVKQAFNLVKTVVKSRDLFMDEKRNLLIVRDTPDALRLAERLLESLDVAEPEVMLEVEVLEVSRSRLSELGLRFPDQVGYGLLSSAGTVADGVVNLRNRSNLTTFVTNPALILNLRVEDGDTNILANPRIRVKNMEKAKIHIGDKLPVFTTTSTANVGVSASVNYLDVGLKLDVEPTVYLQEEVGIRVGLEVSNVVKEVAGPEGSLAYQIGSRSATTTLRLKDGETQVLAGLINDEERNSANKLPGLGDMPIIGRLFSSHRDSRNKTEIVLLITPRILRNLAQPLSSASNISAGTEGSVGTPPLRLKTTAPGSLGVSSSPETTPSASPGLGTPEFPATVPLPEIPPPMMPPPASPPLSSPQEQPPPPPTPPTGSVPDKM